MTRFTVALLLLGLALAGAVVYDLLARGFHRFPAVAVTVPAGTDAERGREAILRHGCGACHVIPGVRQATGRVGPQLVDLESQMFIAGILPNTHTRLAEWIRHPQQINSRTAMPDLGVTEEEAADIAAYLYQARRRGFDAFRHR